MKRTQRAQPPDDRERRWRELMAEFTPKLRSYLRRTHAGSAAMRDMLADVWALAVEHETEIFDSPDPWSVLGPLVREVAEDQVHRGRHERPLDFEPVDPASLSGERSPDPREGSRRSARLTWGIAALASLSERQRDVVFLRCVRHLSDDIIAARLGISESTVRVHAKRGLDRLRKYATATPPPPRPEFDD